MNGRNITFTFLLLALCSYRCETEENSTSSGLNLIAELLQLNDSTAATPLYVSETTSLGAKPEKASLEVPTITFRKQSNESRQRWRSDEGSAGKGSCLLHPADSELSNLSFCIYLFVVNQNEFEMLPPSAYLTPFWPKFHRMVTPVCEANETNHGTSYFFLNASEPPIDVSYFCCKKPNCNHPTAEHLKEAARTSFFDLEELSWSNKLVPNKPKGCYDTDGFFQKSPPNSETCIFHANNDELTVGSLQVGQFTEKWENDGNALLREKLLHHNECFSLQKDDNSSRCWMRMTVDEFEVLCCCYGSVGDCASVARSPQRIAIAHNISAQTLPGKPAPETSASEMFKNPKYHCAMIHAAHDHNGSYELEGSRDEVQYVGGDSCGVIFTLSPTREDRFRMDFRAGSYNSFCFNIGDSNLPVYIEPACPLDAVPGIPTRIMFCCRGHYCNHPKVMFPELNLLRAVQEERMLTERQCPVSYAELLALFLTSAENGFECRIHYDTLMNVTVPLIEDVNMVNLIDSGDEQVFEIESTDGTKVNVTCYMSSVRYIQSSGCPHRQVYQQIDSPLRQLMTCSYRVPDMTSETFEMPIEMAELYEKSEIKLKCAFYNGYLENYVDDEKLDEIVSHSGVCYFKLGYKGNLYIQAGTIAASDDSTNTEQEFLYEMYLEHFVSQARPDGFLTTYDKRRNVVYFICSSLLSYCNVDDVAIDIAEKVFALNFAKKEMDFGWTCNNRECELDLGCFRVASLTFNQTEPIAGCVSDIPKLVRHRPDLGFLVRCYQPEPDVGCQTTQNDETNEVLIYCCCRFACQETIFASVSNRFWIGAEHHDDTLRIL